MAGPVINRLSRDAWKQNGSKSARKRAKEQATKLAEKSSLKPIDDTLSNELKSITSRNL